MAPQQISSKKRDQFLVEIHKAVGRTMNILESSSAALHLLSEIVKLNWAAIYYAAEEENRLTLIASVGSARHLLPKQLISGEGLEAQIAETGKPLIIPRVSQEPLFHEWIETWKSMGSREQSFFSLPIALDFRITGVLTVNLPHSKSSDFNEFLNLFSLLASALIAPMQLQKLIHLERQRLINENVILKQKLQEEYSFHNLIGNSHEMRDVYGQVAQVAPSNTTVLLRGESGTGKELIAEAIHYNSGRSDMPFIRVNCAAVPENLIESEFFGYEKGAFTGAVGQKKGRFEMADRGTIFLDEVGELSLATQVRLLRVLQNQEFERVGGTKSIKVDARIIAATNADIESMLASGTFREDLYYRLNVFTIFLPPLRDRKSDILLLADHFMLKYGRLQGKAVKRISTPAIDMLMRYHWPGNVRELENCIERAVLVCEDQVIHSYHLPPTLQTAESSDTMPRIALKEAVAAYERELVQEALKSTRGNRAKAARLLDTTERIMGYKIKQYEIDISRFKA